MFFSSTAAATQQQQHSSSGGGDVELLFWSQDPGSNQNAKWRKWNTEAGLFFGLSAYYKYALRISIADRAPRCIADRGTAEAAAQQQQHSSGSTCLLYTSPSPRDGLLSRMPSSA